MHALLFTLKLAGVTLSALFGVIGTMHEFRDKNAQLTRWGRAAIGGILVAASLAIAAQFIEDRLKDVSAREAAIQTLESTKRLEVIVHQLDRTLQPLDSVSLFLPELEIPMNDPLFARYKARLDVEIADYKNQNDRSRFAQKGISAPLLDRYRGSPIIVSVSSVHQLFPRFSDEAFVRTLLSVPVVELAFYKTLIDPEVFQPLFHGGPQDADLRIGFRIPRLLEIQKDFQSNRYFLAGKLATSDYSSWENITGKIATIPDLAASQLFLAVGPHAATLDLVDGRKDAFLKLRQRFALGRVLIRFGNRDCWIDESAFTRHVNNRGETFWEYRFPTPPL